MAFDPTKPVEVDEEVAGFNPAAPVEVAPDSQTVARIKSDKRFTPEQTAIRVAAAQEGAKAFKPDEPVSTFTRIAENAKESFGSTLLGTGIKSLQIPLPGDSEPGQELPEGAPTPVRMAKGRLNDLLREQRRRAGTETNLGGQPVLANPTYSEYPDELLTKEINKAQTRYTRFLGPNGENLKKWSLGRAKQIGDVIDAPAARYEAMPDAQGAEKIASVVGAVGGGLPTPENLIPIKAAPPGASLLKRALFTGAQVGAQTAAAEPIRQVLAVGSGQQQEFEPGTAVERVAMGAVIGGGLEVGAAALSKIRKVFAKGAKVEPVAAEAAPTSKTTETPSGEITVQGTPDAIKTADEVLTAPAPAAKSEPVTVTPAEPAKTAGEAPKAEPAPKFTKTTDDLAAGEKFKIDGQDYSVSAKTADGTVTVKTPDGADVVLPPKTEISIDTPKAEPASSVSPRRVDVDDVDAIEAAAAAQGKGPAPESKKNMPQWVRDEMVSRGLDPARPLNDVDVAQPSVREAVKADPSLSEAEKARVLETGSPVDIGPRDASVSTGTGVPTDKEAKMLADWKKQIAAETAPAADGLVEVKINTRDDGEKVLRVTPETKAAYDAERAELKRLQEQIRTSNGDEEYRQKSLKRVAMQSSARQRQILGRMTTKEAAAATQEANVLRPGRPVEFKFGGETIRGTVEKSPAFGKVAIKTEDGKTVRVDARRAKVVQPAVKETIDISGDKAFGKNAAGEGIFQRPDGTFYRMRNDSPKAHPNGYPDFGGDLAPVTEERAQALNKDHSERKPIADRLQRAGYDALTAARITTALEVGDADTIIKATKGRNTVGELQSAYLDLKRLGRIPDHVDRSLRTALITADRDLFRAFDGAETFNNAGIIAIPGITLPSDPIKSALGVAKKAGDLAKAMFNTTGGVSRTVFELVENMRARNNVMVARVRALSDNIARTMGGKFNELDATAAYAYLNPSYLRQVDPSAAAGVRARIAAFKPEVRAALDSARTTIDTMTQRLIKLGVPKDEFAEIMRNNLGRYISRSYKIFGADGENYITRLTSLGTKEYQTRYLPAVERFGQETVDKILGEIQRKGEFDRAKIDGYIDDTVKRLGSTAALDRTLRDQTLRDLFGEIIDPVQSVAHTLLKQQELASTYMFRASLRDHLVASGAAKKINPDEIIKTYLQNESQIIKDRIDGFIVQQKNRAAKEGRTINEVALRTYAESQNPNFDARVRTRVNELRLEAEGLGETFSAENAQRAAERDVYRDYEENAMKWYRDTSGEVAPNQTLVRLDDYYKNDVAMANRVNDPFAELVVNNDSLPMLLEYKKLEPHAMNVIQEISTIANTGATVLAPMTTARNIITSWQTMLSSGNFLRSLTTEEGRAAVRAAAAISSHRIFNTPLSPELRGVYRAVLDAGVMNKGALSGDTANIVEAGRGFFKRSAKAIKNESLDSFTERAKRLRPEESLARVVWGQEGGLERTTRKAQDFYQLGDDFPKVINYLNEVAKAKEAFGNTPEALAEAQRKFNLTNYDYSRTIPFVRMVRKYPIIGGFTSFISESFRVPFNSFSLGLQDAWRGQQTGNKALIQQGIARLTGTTVALASAAVLAEMSRDALGLSYEDERNLREFIPEWDRNAHLYWYRKGDGKVQYINIGNSSLFGAVSQPATEMLKRILHGEVQDDPSATLWNETKDQMWSVVKKFVSLQISAQAVNEALNGHEANGKPIWAADDGVGEKWVKSLGYVMSKVAVPGVAKNIKTVVQGATGETDRFGDPISPTKPLENLAGIGEIDVKKSFKFFSRSRELTLRGIESEFRRMAEDLSTGVTDDVLYAKLADVNERRREYFNDLTRGVRIAEEMDVSRRDLMGELKEQGFSTREIAAIFQGKYEPFVPSKETFIRARKAGRTLDVKRIRDLVIQARE